MVVVPKPWVWIRLIRGKPLGLQVLLASYLVRQTKPTPRRLTLGQLPVWRWNRECREEDRVGWALKPERGQCPQASVTLLLYYRSRELDIDIKAKRNYNGSLYTDPSFLLKHLEHSILSASLKTGRDPGVEHP